MSCLTGIAADGVVALRILDGHHVKGETFLHFCAENLLPEMSPFGPDIPRRCAAMMDNASTMSHRSSSFSLTWVCC